MFFHGVLVLCVYTELYTETLNNLYDYLYFVLLIIYIDIHTCHFTVCGIIFIVNLSNYGNK